MTFHCIAIALLLAALVLQIAVYRAPDLPESHDNAAARCVLMSGLAILILYLSWRAWEGIPSNEVGVLGVCLIAMAEVAFCVNRLFPTVFVHVSERFHHLKGKPSK